MPYFRVIIYPELPILPQKTYIFAQSYFPFVHGKTPCFPSFYR